MEGSRTLVDVGDRTAIASEQTAAAYVRRLAGPGSVVVVAWASGR